MCQVILLRTPKSCANKIGTEKKRHIERGAVSRAQDPQDPVSRGRINQHTEKRVCKQTQTHHAYEMMMPHRALNGPAAAGFNMQCRQALVYSQMYTYKHTIHDRRCNTDLGIDEGLLNPGSRRMRYVHYEGFREHFERVSRLAQLVAVTAPTPIHSVLHLC
jgi:hypothetical protein